MRNHSPRSRPDGAGEDDGGRPALSKGGGFASIRSCLNMRPRPSTGNQKFMARRLRDPEARIEDLERRLERDPSSAAFFPLASLLWEKGEARRAEELLENGLLVHPDYAAAGVLLGEILLARGEREEAARRLEKALEITPWNIAGRRLLAARHREKGDEAAAREALRAVEMFEADEAAVQSAMGGSGEDAASAGAPEDEPAPVPTPSLAELYLAQGHPEKAAGIYEWLLASGSPNAEWEDRLAAIRSRMAPGAERPARTGYPGMDENLDLIAGEIESAKGAAPEFPVEDFERTEAARGEGAEAPDADSLPPVAGEMEAAFGEEALWEEDDEALPEAGPIRSARGAADAGEPPSEPPDEEGADSILMKMVDLYVEEGNRAQALDVCRKARALGRESPLLLERISALEREEAESPGSLPSDAPEEEEGEPLPALSFADREVVEALEGWLAALRRRKANA